VSVTQLHGPALVLLGDAGHAVTPRTGHGFNAALEDAWLLARVRTVGRASATVDV
jgi:kynurenine 3-monooxygenase